MTENPYSSPSAQLTSATVVEKVGIYSPVQVACGTIGGPVGLIYFLKANFDALGNERYARNTLYIGIVLTLLLGVLMPFIPDDIPGSPFTIAYIVTALHISKRYQLEKQAIKSSNEYFQYSNWRVLGYGLICMVGSVFVLFVPAFTMVSMGFAGK